MEYSYYIKKPKQIKHSLLLSSFYREIVKLGVKVVQFLPEFSIGNVRADGLLALPPEPLLALSFQTAGRSEDARAIIQVGIYQNIVVLLNLLSAYLNLYADSPGKFQEGVRRMLMISETFPGTRQPLKAACSIQRS